MRFMQKQFRRLANGVGAISKKRTRRDHPEVVATEVVDCLWLTMQQMVREHIQIFADLGQTYEERASLAETLATTLYRTGLITMPAKHLHSLLLEEEVAMLVMHYLCQSPRIVTERMLVIRLKKRPEYAAFSHDERSSESTTDAIRIRPLGRSPFSDPSTEDFDSSAIATHRMSSVSSDERNHHSTRRTVRVGPSRDTRRTAQCESRAMPGTDLPTRIRGRDTQTDSGIDAQLVTRQSWKRLHKTSLVPHDVPTHSE